MFPARKCTFMRLLCSFKVLILLTSDDNTFMWLNDIMVGLIGLDWEILMAWATDIEIEEILFVLVVQSYGQGVHRGPK